MGRNFSDFRVRAQTFKFKLIHSRDLILTICKVDLKKLLFEFSLEHISKRSIQILRLDCPLQNIGNYTKTLRNKRDRY